MEPDPAALAKRLRDNQTDGAAALARIAVAMLRRFVAEAHPGPDLPARTRACARMLAATRPSMAAVGNLLRLWLDSCSWDAADFQVCAIDHCDAVSARLERAFRETVGAAREHLSVFAPDALVLTHSASSTVRAVIEETPFDWVATASEPGGEGRALATRLGIRCVADAAAAAMLGDATGLVVGADAVGTRSFVNKVGTLGLALAARANDTPVLVVAESYKWVAVANPTADEAAFEQVPNALVAAFISDGQWLPA